MSATNTTTATEKTLGILLPCPCCGAEEASIRLDLSDASMTCLDCDGEFSLETIEDIMARWARVTKWIRSMPSNDE